MRELEPEGGDGERGVIVNTSSIAAFDGPVGAASYVAAKAGIAAMTLPLARELGRYGIRVMAIAPGLFETPMSDALPDRQLDSMLAAAAFPRRKAQPAEYASLVESIVETPMLNGTTIRLDGGLHMG
jgi:NAD(P)-dependent dehydrogenase (short-subunit alcohol dehydrogenase family)